MLRYAYVVIIRLVFVVECATYQGTRIAYDNMRARRMKNRDIVYDVPIEYEVVTTIYGICLDRLPATTVGQGASRYYNRV